MTTYRLRLAALRGGASPDRRGRTHYRVGGVGAMATEERAEYHPEWKLDCMGKWDYDAPLVSLSSRYYPSKGRPKIRPSAHASICVGDLANGPYETLAECDFEGDSEAEVKAAVEKWAAEMIARVDAAIRSEFGRPAPAQGQE